MVRSTRSASVHILMMVCAFLVPAPAVHAQDVTDAERLVIVSVQFEVTEERYASLEEFHRTLDGILRRATRDSSVDVVVFPEYINVPLLFAEYAGVIARSESLEEAVGQVVIRTEDVTSLPELVAQEAQEDTPAILSMWRSLARQYRVAVIPGTFFVLPENGTEDGGVRNRTMVIDADGKILHRQDKVYLTPFEQDVLRLAPGSLDDAESVDLEGADVAITICRDSYFSTWEEPFEGVDVWVDLRANGEPYSNQVRRRFAGTLPERVRAVGADAGVNSSLTGEYLDMIWQGPSYAVDGAGRRIEESPSPVGTSLIRIEVPVATPTSPADQ
ncbi:MAG: nitrilase-related carbon-nitrogen hydrolase [Spirochaetota bacterium]